jgi:hypothetical protein
LGSPVTLARSTDRRFVAHRALSDQLLLRRLVKLKEK